MSKGGNKIVSLCLSGLILLFWIKKDIAKQLSGPWLPYISESNMFDSSTETDACMNKLRQFQKMWKRGFLWLLSDGNENVISERVIVALRQMGKFFNYVMGRTIYIVMRWWWCPLCKPIYLVGFYSASWLKQ